MLATASTGRFRRARRVSSSPTGMPTETASAVETATSQRCSPASDRTSRQLRATNSKNLMPGPPGRQKAKGKPLRGRQAVFGGRQKAKGKRQKKEGEDKRRSSRAKRSSAREARPHL